MYLQASGSQARDRVAKRSQAKLNPQMICVRRAFSTAKPMCGHEGTERRSMGLQAGTHVLPDAVLNAILLVTV